MKDFQTYLKLLVETDEPEMAPGANLEAAKTPIQAYIAYRRELNDLMNKVQGALGKAEMQLDALHGKVSGYLDTAKSKVDIAAQTAALSPTKARPTINRNRNDSLVAKYAPTPTNPQQQQGE